MKGALTGQRGRLEKTESRQDLGSTSGPLELEPLLLSSQVPQCNEQGLIALPIPAPQDLGLCAEPPWPFNEGDSNRSCQRAGTWISYSSRQYKE